MAFVGTNFSELIAEYVRIEKVLQEAGYCAAYCICGEDRRTEHGHVIVVVGKGECIGEEVLKIADFVESRDPVFRISLMIYNKSTKQHIFASIPANKK